MGTLFVRKLVFQLRGEARLVEGIPDGGNAFSGEDLDDPDPDGGGYDPDPPRIRRQERPLALQAVVSYLRPF